MRKRRSARPTPARPPRPSDATAGKKPVLPPLLDAADLIPASLAPEVLAVIEEGSTSSSDDREFDRIFRQWKKTGNPALREHLIERNRKLVRFLARQFKDRGEPLDDLVQVGSIGLINAVDRYDPSYGWKFSTFATPTIVGEIKRYFRDKGWSMKVPRRLQELNLEATKRIDRLTQELGRSPFYSEIANAVNAREDEVIEALEMAQAYELMSLDTESPYDEHENRATLSDQLGVEDLDLQNWEMHMDLQKAMEAALDPRERRVLLLVFYQERSQTEIAQKLGMSQMHVSRIQRRALAKLREYMRKN